MVACNFGISKTTLTYQILRFQEQASATDFEYAARDNAKKSFSATQKLELVKYFKQAAKLHYGYTEDETLKLAF
jgi:hypothetical protein